MSRLLFAVLPPLLLAAAGCQGSDRLSDDRALACPQPSGDVADCVTDGDDPPEIVTGCNGGPEACEGDANCETCIIDGGCAEGPSPIWIVGSTSIPEGCICAQPSEPETCQFEYCCALGFEWSPEQCDCVEEGGGEPPDIVSGCTGGADACAGDPNCETCINDGACAQGPDPIWIVGSTSIPEGCICAQPSEPETCQFEFCCALGSEWNPEQCDCVEQDPGEPPEIVSGCNGGPEACAGDASCETCIIDGGCAEGPSPIWIVGSTSIPEGCICAQASEPESCQFEFCCALGFEWSPEECDCIPCDPPSGGTH